MGPAAKPVAFVCGPVSVVKLAGHQLVVNPLAPQRLATAISPRAFAIKEAFDEPATDGVSLDIT